MADPSAQLITKRADLSFNITERANAEVIWREIATFMLPNASSFIITGSRGQGGTGGITTTTRLFDGTAIRANRELVIVRDFLAPMWTPADVAACSASNPRIEATGFLCRKYF